MWDIVLSRSDQEILFLDRVVIGVGDDVDVDRREGKLRCTLGVDCRRYV